MTRKKKIFISVFIPVFLVLLFFLLNLYVKGRIQNSLEDLGQKISYENLNVNIFLNRFSLEDLQTRQNNISISAKKVKISGVSYSKLVFKNNLEINDLVIQEPEIIQFPADSSVSKQPSDRSIIIDRIQLTNGSFSRKKSDSAEASMFLRFPEVTLKPVNGNMKDLKPESYKVHLDSVYWKMNAEHYINVGNTEAENGKVAISDLKIIPLYNKSEFDKKIPYEKDRISLEVNKISLDSLAFESVNDTLHFSNSNMQISEALLEIYRNKLNPDDPRKKSLYNELLRKLPVKIDFEKVHVKNSEIIYEEQVQAGRKAAIIRFSGVNGEIENLHNIKGERPQPKVKAQADFMRGTPVSINLSFPVFDPANSFDISGNFGELQGEALDPFLVPAMDVQTRGQINSIHFNFAGNEDVMQGDFQMDYDELDVQLLKNEGKNERNIFSAIANLFVENEGDAGGEDEKIRVERDKQRSFWNYVWRGVRKGFMEVVAQL